MWWRLPSGVGTGKDPTTCSLVQGVGAPGVDSGSHRAAQGACPLTCTGLLPPCYRAEGGAASSRVLSRPAVGGANPATWLRKRGTPGKN